MTELPIKTESFSVRRFGAPKAEEEGAVMKRCSCLVVIVCSVICSARVLADLVPGGAESAGLTRVVPDTLVTNNDGFNSLSNWDPYASLVGNSVFLIQANTYARRADGTRDPLSQRHALLFQKVDGGCRSWVTASSGTITRLTAR